MTIMEIFYFLDETEKLVMLPKQLEAVARATTMPKEVHRWNTNEVNSILVHFLWPYVFLFSFNAKHKSGEIKLHSTNGFHRDGN